jgi:hypothetical protein
MISIHLQYTNKLRGVDTRIEEAIKSKVLDLTRLMYEKVMENLSGKILQVQTGQLRRSVRTNVWREGKYKFLGEVIIDPPSAKAWALEMGGTKSYAILPAKASILHWFRYGRHNYALRVLHHPPSKEYNYLRSVVEGVRPMLKSAMAEAVQAAIDGGSE